jgi:hypothetical protein
MFRRIQIMLLLFTGFCATVPAAAQERALLLAWENDMWNRKDWYFSNGINIGLFHPALRKSPVNFILLPGGPDGPGSDGTRTLCGLQLRQEIYTPMDIGQEEIREGDHPYAATLSLVSEKTLMRERHRISSGLQIGVIGPAALGFRSQEFIHRITPSDPPKGWNNQVGNDLMLNYLLSFERSVYADEWSDFILQGRARLGTVYTDAYAGFLVRMEDRPKYFRYVGPDPERPFNLYFEMGGGFRLVGYDASLQGGMINRTSPYTIPASSVSRVVADVRLSTVFELQRHQLLLCQHMVSPRFDRSKWHAWLQISYRYWW